MVASNNEQLVAEAKQRLAAKGGRPSDLQAMMQRIRNEGASAMDVHQGRAQTGAANNGNIVSKDDAGFTYNYNPQYDVTTITTPDGRQTSKRGNAIPGNNMDGYIDKVLEMSGMTGGGNNMPTPSPRPGVDEGMTTPTPRPDMGAEDIDADTQQKVDEAVEAGMPISQILLLGAGMAGVAGIGRYLYKKFGQGDGADAGADAKGDRVSNPDRIDPAFKGDMSQADAIDESINATMGDEPDAPPKALPGQKKLTGPDADESSIEDTIRMIEGDDMSQENIDQVFQERAGPADGTPPATTGQPVRNTDSIIDEVAGMSVREAVNHLRQNGIEINDSLMKVLADKVNAARAGSAAIRGAL